MKIDYNFSYPQMAWQGKDQWYIFSLPFLYLHQRIMPTKWSSIIPRRNIDEKLKKNQRWKSTTISPTSWLPGMVRPMTLRQLPFSHFLLFGGTDDMCTYMFIFIFYTKMNCDFFQTLLFLLCSFCSAFYCIQTDMTRPQWTKTNLSFSTGSHLDTNTFPAKKEK